MSRLANLKRAYGSMLMDVAAPPTRKVSRQAGPPPHHGSNTGITQEKAAVQKLAAGLRLARAPLQLQEDLRHSRGQGASLQPPSPTAPFITVAAVWHRHCVAQAICSSARGAKATASTRKLGSGLPHRPCHRSATAGLQCEGAPSWACFASAKRGVGCD